MKNGPVKLNVSFRIITYDHSYYQYMLQISKCRILGLNFKWKSEESYRTLEEAEHALAKLAAKMLQEKKKPKPGTVLKMVPS